MKELLQIKCSGWTASPRMPFILSGNSVCMHAPSYSMIIGMLGCCLGRYILANEVQIGFHYSFDSVAKDIERRHRLENKNQKIKMHHKGTDAYTREFHTRPKITIWIDRLDWEELIVNPKGTPSLGASQDIVRIKSVEKVIVDKINKAKVSGTMIPFEIGQKSAGQLVQLAESFEEAGNSEEGRIAVNSKTFMAIPSDGHAELETDNLFQIRDKESTQFYLHKFGL